MEKVKTFFTAKNVTYLAVFVALIIVLQMCSSFIKIGSTSFSFVLVPIVLGGMLMGVGVGAILGAVFGLTVIVAAFCGLDSFTLYMITENPIFTVALCLIKGIAAGVVSSLLYKVISLKNRYVAVFVAAAAAPIVNTGIFVIGAFFTLGTISGAFASFGTDVSGLSPIYIVFVMCVGVNFFVELAISIVCSPALYTVNRVIEKQFMRHKKRKSAAKANIKTDTKCADKVSYDNMS